MSRTGLILSLFPLLRRLAVRTLAPLLDRPLPPPSEAETELTRRLLEEAAALPRAATAGVDPAWAANAERLRTLISSKDPREFLRWDVIRDSMFETTAPYLSLELDYLKSLPDWPRWEAALVESPAGRPLPFPFYPRSSGNLIHHAYHLARFEHETGERVDRFGLVVEFGGGYGSMARLLHKLGFSGKHLIYDLNIFCALQKFYLASTGLRGCDAMCLDDPAKLEEELRRTTGRRSLLIATWSLSEAPVPLRARIRALTDKFDAFLIAYQHVFSGVRNRAEFERWTESVPGVAWRERPIAHLPGSAYLFGTRGGPADQRTRMIRVNVGCGRTPTPGWMNFDNSASLRLARHPILSRALAGLKLLDEGQRSFIDFARSDHVLYGDAMRGLPVPDASADALYSSHMLEHLDPAEADAFMIEARRVLAPGGVLRLVVPDLKLLAIQYLRDGDSEEFLNASLLCAPRPKTLMDRLRFAFVGGRHHRWMYDDRSLIRLLERHGFEHPRILRPGETTIRDPGPLNLREREGESLYCEARRP